MRLPFVPTGPPHWPVDKFIAPVLPKLLMVKLYNLPEHGLVRNSSFFCTINALVEPVVTYGAGPSIQVKPGCVFRIFAAISEVNWMLLARRGNYSKLNELFR